MVVQLVPALLIHLFLFVLSASCCKGEESEPTSPTDAQPTPPKPTPAPPDLNTRRSPQKSKEHNSEKPKVGGGHGKLPDTTKPNEERSQDRANGELKQQVRLRELADESQMSKSLYLMNPKAEPTEMSEEVDDPFDCKQLPLPPKELRDPARDTSRTKTSTNSN